MQLKVKITKEEFNNVVSNALAGIWHWGSINKQDEKTYRVKERGDPGRCFSLSRRRLEKGLAQAMLHAPALASQVAEYGVDGIDYPRADLVVQYALFGEVRYA